MLSDWQFNPFYGSTEGTDPNNYINADQLLQGDRRHMLNVQANFLLPWGMHAGTMVTLQSGRAYARQTDVWYVPDADIWLNQGRTTIIMEPANDGQRFPNQAIIDFSIGKRFGLGGGAAFNIDLQFFNLLNEDAPDYWQNLSISYPDRFTPWDAWITLPRRLQIRLGIEF
jgi:hypothetical protein